MQTIRTWGWATLTLLAATMVTAAPGRNDPGLTQYQKFHSGPPTVAPEPPAKPKTKAPDAESKAKETAGAMKAQEEANLFRRLSVCDKLKQIALDQGDSRLEEEAIRLEERATEVYKQRTLHLTPAKAKKPEPREEQP